MRRAGALERPSPGLLCKKIALSPTQCSAASVWVAVCTDLLEAAKDCTSMRGLREPLVSRGFRCSTSYQAGNFTVTVPSDFPCYYDVVGKNYSPSYAANRDYATRRAWQNGRGGQAEIKRQVVRFPHVPRPRLRRPRRVPRGQEETRGAARRLFGPEYRAVTGN